MSEIDMNYIARLITLDEGGKKNQNIGDVKEVFRRLRVRCRESLVIWSRVSRYLRYDRKDAFHKKAPKKAALRGKR
jgi:hypothetical protein